MQQVHRYWTIAGLAVGVAALVLQFSLTIPAGLAQGRSLPGALVHFFSYFTIQTNVILVLIYAASLFRPAGWLSFFARPIVRAAAAAMIALVMGFYHFILMPTWSPEGWWLLADVALHYAAPILYLGWFVLFSRSGTLQWSGLLKMLVYPALYVLYIMGRGAVAGEYPYPTFEAHTLGYAQVGLNTLALLGILSVLNAIAIFADRSGASSYKAN